jgi:Arm DNA-binding domain
MTDRKRIGLRDVRALGPNQEVWDAAVPGFGARRQKSDVISYVLMYRTGEGRQRRFTIGRHGAPWTPDMARDEAIRLRTRS